MTNRVRIYIAIDLVLLLAGTFALVRLHRTPAVPFESTQFLDHIVVTTSHVPDQISEGATILRIDGFTLRSPDDALIAINRKDAGELVQVDGFVKNISWSTRVRLEERYPLRYILITGFVSLFIWFTGVYVFLSRPEARAATTFHWVMMAFWLTASIATTQHVGHQSPILVFFLRALYLTGFAFLPSLFVNFSLQFPTVEERFGGIFRVIVFAPAILFAIMFLATQGQITIGNDVDLYPAFYRYFSFFHLYVAMFLLLGLGLLAWRYKSGLPQQRKQMRWLVWGIALGGFPWILFQALPLGLGIPPPISEEMANLFMFFVPLGFGIAIAREGMLDIDIVINRTVVYAVLSAVVLGLYVGVTSLFTLLLGSMTQDLNVYLSAGFTIAIALFFQPAKERLQSLVDRLFYRMTYDFRLAAQTITPELTRAFSSEDLANTLVNGLEKYLQVELVLLAIQPDEARSLFKCTGEPPVSLAEARALTEKITASDEQPAVEGLAKILPFRSEFGAIIGIVGLGKKKSGSPFLPEEIEFAESAIEIASVSSRRLDLLERVILDQFEKEKLEQQKHELEMLQKMREDLSSMIVHDLRNPLTNILLVIEELKRRVGDKLTAQDISFLTLSITGGRQLLEMINDLLEIHKMEEGQLQLYKEKTALHELISGAMKQVEMLAEQKSIRLELATGSEQMQAFVDKEKLTRVVVNILSNAIKFSAKKSSIHIAASQPAGRGVVVSVKDAGPGIPPEFVGKVFDKFVQLESRQEGKRFSTGLGLTYCKLAVENHGGKIWAESELGKGSTFFFEIPA